MWLNSLETRCWESRRLRAARYVQPRPCTEMPVRNVKHILVPTDFAPASAEAVEWALELAAKFDAELTLLHTWEIPPYPYVDYVMSIIDLSGTLEKAASGALATALENVRTRFPRVKSVLKLGLPWQEIVGAVQDLGVDLVVMGSHGRHGFDRVLMGSVAEKVVRLCSVPVLTVRSAPKNLGAP